MTVKEFLSYDICVSDETNVEIKVVDGVSCCVSARLRVPSGGYKICGSFSVSDDILNLKFCGVTFYNHSVIIFCK